MAETPLDYSPDATPLAPAPATATRELVNLVPSSPEGCTPPVAPSTPDWLLNRNAPSPPACPSTDACPVCLCEFPTHPAGPETPFLWPGCGHALHLGCVAHLTANVRDLRCPTCRAPWPPQATENFTTACRGTVFPLHSRPPITTPRLAATNATTKPQHRGPLNTFCRFAAHASSWQTRRMPHRMLLGKN